MTRNPKLVSPEQPISRAAQIMRDSDVGMVPVVKDLKSQTLVGVITDRDITIRCVADTHGGPCTVGGHMTRDNLETVGEDAEAGAVLNAMRRRELRRIPVTGTDGKVIGVIAQADIAMTDEISKEQVGEVVKAISEPVRH
jgi:CBS domain-containing protein